MPAFLPARYCLPIAPACPLLPAHHAHLSAAPCPLPLPYQAHAGHLSLCGGGLVLASFTCASRAVIWALQCQHLLQTHPW